MNDTVISQISALHSKSGSELKDLWQELYQSTPPSYNKLFLIKRLAYRIQELAFGGMTKKMEEKLINYTEDTKHSRSKTLKPVTGTRLLRIYQGIEHQVTVLADGFEYQGQKYKSLSVIARKIAGGTRWSGPAFFGLKRRAGGKNHD